VRLDADTGTGSYVNAGHTPCLVLRHDGSVDVLKPCGPPIGLLPGLGYDENPLRFAPGDTLALFSDGVTETWNAGEEEFGEDRLVEVLRASRGEPAHVVVSRIIGALDEFAGGAPQHDDITLLVVRRLA
jgi:sigma-B regulation protein RsbU (phosphoserine phosphatase)